MLKRDAWADIARDTPSERSFGYGIVPAVATEQSLAARVSAKPFVGDCIWRNGARMMTSTQAAVQTAERSPWRWPAAAAALGIAAAHVPITPQHLSEAPYIGWSFVALEVAAVLLAIVLIARDTPAVWWTAAVVPALAIGAYLLTRTVALPQLSDDVGNWTEPLSFVALTAESLLFAIATARRTGTGRASNLVTHPRLFAVLLLVLGLAATGWFAASSNA